MTVRGLVGQLVAGAVDSGAVLSGAELTGACSPGPCWLLFYAAAGGEQKYSQNQDTIDEFVFSR
jgi:hypothetical protein